MIDLAPEEVVPRNRERGERSEDERDRRRPDRGENREEQRLTDGLVVERDREPACVLKFSIGHFCVTFSVERVEPDDDQREVDEREREPGAEAEQQAREPGLDHQRDSNALSFRATRR